MADPRGVELRVESVISNNGLRDACALTDVLTAVARHRSRNVELEPLPADADTGHLFGLCLPYPDRDVILYRAGAGADHELHSTLHECGHLLLDHVGGPSSAPVGNSLALLLPDLDPHLVAAALARSAYDDVHEQEAETFAMLVGRIIEVQQHRRGDAIINRFDDALG